MYELWGVGDTHAPFVTAPGHEGKGLVSRGMGLRSVSIALYSWWFIFLFFGSFVLFSELIYF